MKLRNEETLVLQGITHFNYATPFSLRFWLDPQTSSFWMRKREKQTNIELEKRKT